MSAPIRTVTVQLDDDEHEALDLVATLVGRSRAAVARALVVSGARGVLEDQRRLGAAARRPKPTT